MVHELIIVIGFVGAISIALAVCGFVADYIMPHIGPLERYIQSLPLEDDDDDEN